MSIDAAGILMDIGITNVSNVQGAPHLIRCELWIGEDDSIIAKNSRTRVLILHSGFSEDHIAGAKQRLASIGASVQLVLFEDSMPSFDLQNKAAGAFPDARVLTIGACLRQAIFRGQKIDEPPPVDYYVPPTIVPASGPVIKDSAITMLLGWIRGGVSAGTEPGRVGVLLAPAGTGKTALATELFKHVLHRPQATDPKLRRANDLPFPLLIDRFAWIDHEFRETSDNLADLVGNAIYRQFRFQPPIDRIQRSLRYGAISPILDGFDELCATNPSLFGADDTIKGLVNALQGVNGNRILLTCRESFWHDNVDVKLQSQVTAFRLKSFSEDQRREYLTKRFPTAPEQPKKERTLGLLQKISSMRGSASATANSELHNLSFLPWVVQFAAEATDAAILDRSAFDAEGTVPEADPLGHVLWQFCRREQQRIGIALSSEGQIRFFSSLAALCNEWFPIDRVDTVHALLSGEPGYPGDNSHVEFLRKHGFLRIVGKDIPNNCRFEYPEVQDYLRARVAVDSVCGALVALGDEDIFRRCATEQTRLVDFVSLLLRWQLSVREIVSALALQCQRFNDTTSEEALAAQAGLLQILLRVLRDDNLSAMDTTSNVCRYFGDPNGRIIKGAYLNGLISRIDFRGVSFYDSKFRNTHLEHCIFDSDTAFVNCGFEGEFRAAMNCKSLGDATVDNCSFSDDAMATFRQHKNKVGRLQIDRSHIEEACHNILRQFHIGQMGLRSKSYVDVKSGASKSSPIGEEILDELLRSGVLEEEKAGTKHSIEVKDRSAVSAFIQQSTPRGSMAQAINKLASRHVKSRR